jgi:hypothetical protein
VTFGDSNISEGFGTVEAVRRENRAKFHAQNVPKVEVTNKSAAGGLNCVAIEIKANHSLHPGIAYQDFLKRGRRIDELAEMRPGLRPRFRRNKSSGRNERLQNTMNSLKLFYTGRVKIMSDSLLEHFRIVFGNLEFKKWSS